MKKYKAVSIMCMLLCLNLLLTGCRVTLWSFTNPTEQPGTIWRSEDGIIEFRISEDGDCAARGTMNVSGETLEVIYNIAPAEYSITVYLAEYWDQFPHDALVEPDVLKNPDLWGEYFMAEDPLESWICYAVSNNTFRVKVQESTYFHEGDIIVLHKVDS